MYLLQITIGAFALFLFTSCGTVGTGVPYVDAVQRAESYLEAEQKEYKVFGISKEAGEQKTVLRFIEGDSRNKEAHGWPQKVRVTILPKGGGSNSVISAQATNHGLVLAMRDEEKAKRWKRLVEAAVVEQNFSD